MVNRARRLDFALMVMLSMLAAGIYLRTHPHTWQQMHAWPQYNLKGCAALQDGYRELEAGERESAVERFREAEWQWRHVAPPRDARGWYFSQPRAVREVADRLEDGWALSAATVYVRDKWHPFRCFAGQTIVIWPISAKEVP